jgi:hypothetical protein
MDVTLIGGSRQARFFGWGASPRQPGGVPGQSSYNENTITTTTVIANSNLQFKNSIYSTFQATVTGTGAVTATVVIQVSNDDTALSNPANMNWCQTPLGTITLSGTTSASDGFTSNSSWKYVRAQVTAITGTNAAVSVIMGV